MDKASEKNLIIILSANGGAEVSARAIKQYMEKNYKDCEIVIINDSEYTSFVHKTMDMSIKKVSNTIPFIGSFVTKIKYNLFAQKNSQKTKKSKQNSDKTSMNFLNSVKIIRNIYNRLLPKVIISTDLLSHNLSMSARKKYNLDVVLLNIYPLLFVDKRFINKLCDGYIVENEEIASAFIAGGVEAEKISVSGLCTFAKFVDSYDKIKLKEEIKLPDSPIVLINATDIAGIQVKKLITELVLNNGTINILVVTGKNESLKENIESYIAKNRFENVKIYGFMTEMDKLLKVSDFFVFSGGSMSFTEASLIGVPSLIFNPTTFVEMGNQQYLTRHLLVESAENAEVLSKKINHLIGNPEEYKFSAVNINKYSKINAIKNITDFIRIHVIKNN